MKICDIADGRYGPIFGGETKHMFVLTVYLMKVSSDLYRLSLE